MTKLIKLACYVLAACTVSVFSNCSKKPSDEKMPEVDPAILNAMYPISQSYSDLGSPYTYESDITYDKDNHLIKINRDSTVINEINSNTINTTINFYRSSDRKLEGSSLISYVFSMVGDKGAAVNIYDGAPTQLESTNYYKDMYTGVTRSSKGFLLQFFVNEAGQMTKVISSDGGGYNQIYSYDDNKNLNRIEFVKLSGPRVNLVNSRLLFTSFDDKPSPFSNVKGFWPIYYAIGGGDSESYSWAFCKNNPKQIIEEVYNADKKMLVVLNQYDFSYNSSLKIYIVKRP